MRTRWSSLFVHLFVAGSLLSSIHGFDYDKLSMDTMTGILVKPEEWSLRKFTLIKELRMKVSSWVTEIYSWLRHSFLKINYLGTAS